MESREAPYQNGHFKRLCGLGQVEVARFVPQFFHQQLELQFPSVFVHFRAILLASQRLSGRAWLGRQLSDTLGPLQQRSVA